MANLKGPAYGNAAALTVGTPLATAVIGDLPVCGLLITATVAGNVSILLSGGATVVVAVAVGTVLLQLSVLGINTSGTTATATYYALA